MPNYKNIETKLICAGEARPRIRGAVAMPIFQSATFETDEDREYHDIRYVRLNNTPNHEVLHAKLAAIENAEAGLVTSSGMAAISTTLVALLQRGDHLLIQDCVYGGTHDLLDTTLAGIGVDYDFIDAADPDSWDAKVKKTTRAIYVETISNPLMGVPALDRVVDFARAHDLFSMIDNTFATPVNFRPPEIGFDISLHSATKYLNGHSDIAAGVVVGKAEQVELVRKRLNLLGGTLDPHACFLLHRGVKTLALRMRQHNQSALTIAQFLSSHAAVETVNYAGLETSPSYANAKKFLKGCGGMLSFELKGGETAADRLLQKIAIPVVAPSLGALESLMTLPARTSHRGLSAQERKRIGIGDGLVRISVGIESTQDLIDDLNQAMS